MYFSNLTLIACVNPCVFLFFKTASSVYSLTYIQASNPARLHSLYLPRWRSGFRTSGPNSRNWWSRAAARSTPTHWPLAVDFRAALPRWHRCGARRPPWRRRWALPDLTFPATPHGIQPHTKSLCNSHSSCEHGPQPSTLLVARVSGRGRGRGWLIMRNTEPRNSLPHAADWHRGLLIPDDGKQWGRRRRRRKELRDWIGTQMRPGGNKALTVSGNRRQMDFFGGGAAVYHLCFFLSYLCELFYCWAC